MNKSIINYSEIFKDILDSKYPEKKQECFPLLKKRNLSSIDILKINRKIFLVEETENNSSNNRLRSYNKSDIAAILDFQKKHKLNNSQLANHFKISRNTITKWKKLFLT